MNGDADDTVDIIQAAYTYFYFQLKIFRENSSNFTFLRQHGLDHVTMKSDKTFSYIAHWLRDKTKNLSKDIDSGGNTPIPPDDDKPNVKPDNDDINSGGTSDIPTDG